MYRMRGEYRLGVLGREGRVPEYGRRGGSELPRRC